MALENQIDANFYNLIHQLISTEQDAPRRQHDRQQYVATQRIALRRRPGIPDESEFLEVQCQDLSRAGFSFLMPSPPNFVLLVAAFGVPPEVVYVGTKVAHTREVLVDRQGRVVADADGDIVPTLDDALTPMVLVGCQFTERLHR